MNNKILKSISWFLLPIKETIIWLGKSGENSKYGASARKITSYGFLFLAAFVQCTQLTSKNAFMFFLADIICVFLGLGLVTADNLIRALSIVKNNGNNTEKTTTTEEITDVKTETTENISDEFK